MSQFTVGVEEEYQLIDPTTRELVSRSNAVLREAQTNLGNAPRHELQQSQVEIATRVCHSLNEVRERLITTRHTMAQAAQAHQSKIAAAGTHPFSHWKQQKTTQKQRYLTLEETYQQLADEQLIFGCHVHVGLPDPALGIAVMNRVRPWLAPLLALTANSPFWLGKDTGYASYRTQIWSRWPMSGPPQAFKNKAEYEALVQALVQTECIEDASKIYWDVRLPTHLDTIEFRLADVCLTIDETVMLTGLVRGLVQTCYQHAEQQRPYEPVRQELLRMARWQAARYGLNGQLINIIEKKSIPAPALIETMLNFIRPALEDTQDWLEVSQLTNRVLQEGNGATRQRKQYQMSNNMPAVVDFILHETNQETTA